LTKPTLFNDPYDSLLFIDRRKIVDTILNSESYNEDLVEKLKVNLEFRESQIKLLGVEFVDMFLKINSFKNQKEKDYFVKLSNEQSINFADKIIDEAVKSLKQSSLIACLSEKNDSMLMWSHYAQNHEGFALNYNFKSRYIIDIGLPNVVGSEFADKKLFPVRYSDERFDATYYVEFHFIDNFYRSLGLKFNAPFFD